jgi:HD-GYP domain-containing protein (c-di-GMP phosphodiesterase class II)
MANKMNKVMATLAIAFALLLSTVAFAQEFPTAAMTLYGQNRFQEAYDLIVQTIPEETKRPELKNAAGDYLTEMGVAEYRKRNFKNAYQCFRKALKYTPTNSTATQYFLKMKKEHDVANLQNEWIPSAPEIAAAPEVSAAPGSSGNTLVAQGANATDVNNLIKQLGEAERKLSSLQDSGSEAKRDNEILKAQLEQQRSTLRQLSAQQSAGNRASNSEEQAVIKETLKVMNAVAARLEKEQAPQVIVQPQGGLLSWIPIALMSFIALMILAITIAVIVVFVKARARRSAQGRHAAGFTLPVDTHLIGAAGFSTPLLDYRGEPSGNDRALAVQESGIKRDLLKAEHLNRLYEEVRNGTLSWETVRKYIGEMETELKASILKIVEIKLDEGDLVSNEAILPVLFPFLTDYDEFIREKAERLARTALSSGQSGAQREGDDEEAVAGPFDVTTLLAIPKKLKIVLKGNDQSLVVAKLSRGIAKNLGMSVSDCQDIYKAALAHDAGYLVLDQDKLQQILAKTEISEEDFAFIQGHAMKAPLYFGDVKVPANIREAMFYHHERNDGSGYPKGLKKDEIPVFAKIIGLAETFAALIARRTYRDKVDYGQALAIIRDSRTKFDQEIITALTKVVKSSGSYK